MAVARLGLEHERLQAELRAQLGALRSARRRIVDAGDARRKRLERDLHDGAQQHLIALSIALRMLDRDRRTVDLVDDAAVEVQRALDDLRDVAHGIYPPVLDDEGLAAAVEALAEAATVPIRIGELVEDRCTPASEIAAYQLVVAAVRSATGAVDVRIQRIQGQLRVEVALLAIADDVVEDVADRVGAVDGTVSVSRSAGMAKVIAEIPCAS
jgi:signal transduction histidine kinase